MTAHNLVIDVEATGPHPNPYSLLQIGAVDLNGNEFYGEFRPRTGTIYDPNAMNAIGLTIEDVLIYTDFNTAANDFNDWIATTYKGQRVTTWSDNPAFDWQYVNECLWSETGGNPLGFSMRRIGDFYAGLKGNVGHASKWKRLRQTKHTHNALDDAKGKRRSA